MLSALMKDEVSMESGLATTAAAAGEEGDTLEPLNWRLRCRARRVWICCSAACTHAWPEMPSASSSSVMPLGMGVRAKRNSASMDR